MMMMMLACKPASSIQDSPGPLGSDHNTLSVWKTPPGTFPFNGIDHQLGSCYLCHPTANIPSGGGSSAKYCTSPPPPPRRQV